MHRGVSVIWNFASAASPNYRDRKKHCPGTRAGHAPANRMASALPYKISVLVFLENRAGELLLIHRNKAPNLGNWSPIGGKLEMAAGESPF